MEKDFRYYIVDDQGRSYYVNESGSVVISSIPKDLQYTPDGWQDKTIAYGRSARFPGVLRTFTLPLRYTMDGAKILRYLYYTYGIQAKGNQVILKRDIVTNTDVYKQYYVGSMDLSQVADQQGNKTVECNVMEGGLSELIKANEGTKYEIPLSVPEAIDVQFDGITLYSVANIVNYADLISDGSGGEVPNTITSTYVYFGTAVVNTETQYPSILWATSTVYHGTENIEVVNEDDWPLKSQESVTTHFKGAITVTVAGSTGLQLFGLIKAENGAFRRVDISSVYPSGGFPEEKTIQFDTTIDLNADERMFLGIENMGGGDGKIISFNVENKFSITYNYRRATTTVKCLRPFYVFNELVKKITNGKYQASSTLLMGDAADTVLTCGDALRGFVKGTPADYAGPVLKTSLNDFLASYNTRYNLGLGLRDTAIIERKSTFFNDNDLVDLGEVANLVVSPASDHLFNTVKIGWPNQTYDDVNGRSEFNTTHIYSTPVTRVVKELDLSSVYRADCYGIEFARINLENKTTTDSGSDNDIFMINVTGYGPYTLNRPAYTSMTGVPSPDVFNVELTPKRCLNEHGSYLHIGLDKLDTGYLTYQTQDKNPELSTTLGGVTITEKANVQIATLAAPLFLPHVFEFDTELPLNIVDLIEADPYGKVKFTWEDNEYYGYILECSQQPAMNPKQIFKLLAGKDNNMLNLI